MVKRGEEKQIFMIVLHLFSTNLSPVFSEQSWRLFFWGFAATRRASRKLFIKTWEWKNGSSPPPAASLHQHSSIHISFQHISSHAHTQGHYETVLAWGSCSARTRKILTFIFLNTRTDKAYLFLTTAHNSFTCVCVCVALRSLSCSVIGHSGHTWRQEVGFRVEAGILLHYSFIFSERCKDKETRAALFTGIIGDRYQESAEAEEDEEGNYSESHVSLCQWDIYH